MNKAKAMTEDEQEALYFENKKAQFSRARDVARQVFGPAVSPKSTFLVLDYIFDSDGEVVAARHGALVEAARLARTDFVGPDATAEQIQAVWENITDSDWVIDDGLLGNQYLAAGLAVDVFGKESLLQGSALDVYTRLILEEEEEEEEEDEDGDE